MISNNNKGNPNHDENGRFTSKGNEGSGAPKQQQVDPQKIYSQMGLSQEDIAVEKEKQEKIGALKEQKKAEISKEQEGRQEALNDLGTKMDKLEGNSKVFTDSHGIKWKKNPDKGDGKNYGYSRVDNPSITSNIPADTGAEPEKGWLDDYSEQTRRQADTEKGKDAEARQKLEKAGFELDYSYTGGNTYQILDKSTGRRNNITLTDEGYYSTMINGQEYDYPDLDTAIDRAKHSSGKSPDDGAMGWENGEYVGGKNNKTLKQMGLGGEEDNISDSDITEALSEQRDYFDDNATIGEVARKIANDVGSTPEKVMNILQEEAKSFGMNIDENTNYKDWWQKEEEIENGNSKVLNQMGLDSEDFGDSNGSNQVSWSSKVKTTPEQDGQINQVVNEIFPGKDWRYLMDNTDSPMNIRRGIEDFLETGNSEYLLNVLQKLKERYEYYRIKI